MVLQNRVTPWGTIEALPFRGRFTGNRGILHDPETRTLHPVRRWTTKAWIYCVCDHKGRKRDVMGANGPNGSAGWTNLFFLDEATALSAGHRPCFACQHARAKSFQAAWTSGHDGVLPTAKMMDAVLDAERRNGHGKRLHPIPAPLANLPTGTFVAADDLALMVHKGRLFAWQDGRYTPVEKPRSPLTMLTPPSIVRTMLAGFAPQIAVDFRG